MPPVKIAIVLALLLIIGSMANALFHMMRSPTQSSDKMVRSLTLRVILSIGLFAFLLVANALGIISPHSIG